MTELTSEIVREFLDYNPETGVFRWKFRDRKWFTSDRSWKSWNGKNAGKSAGTKRSDGYRRITILDKRYLAHRLAWLYVYREWPQNHIDHINHQTDNNRIENLRDVTQSQNQWNGSGRTGTSQYKGVSWSKHANKGEAYLTINSKQHLGYFTVEKDAARAYDRAALQCFGEYAKLNFPVEDY